VGNNGALLGVGMFIFRSAAGTGTFSVTNFTAAINAYPGTYEVRGFALEMVHIPTGAYYLGDGENGYRDGVSPANAPFTPYLVTSGTINLGTNTGQLEDILYTGSISSITNFPKAYNSYWMMKYELNAGAYRDFLNTLTYTQQEGNMALAPSSAAGTNIADQNAYSEIRIVTAGVANTTPAVVACNAHNDATYNEATDGEWDNIRNISYPEAAAYLDWAGLRPMTEMEYEKACRGPLPPVAGELAWGDASLATVTYTLANENTNNETVTNASSVAGNAFLAVLSPNGNVPHRVGLFGTNTSTRLSAGAGYYGAMDLTGLSLELAVTTANDAGRSYTGKHGDGILTTTGHANENYWPAINGNTGIAATAPYNGGLGVLSDGGIIYKGGYTNFSATTAEVSKRLSPNTNFDGAEIIYSGTVQTSYFAIRGVRDSNL
jgi:formylglycine-generating enzyme required for sulfatase activity